MQIHNNVTKLLHTIVVKECKMAATECQSAKCNFFAIKRKNILNVEVIYNNALYN